MVSNINEALATMSARGSACLPFCIPSSHDTTGGHTEPLENCSCWNSRNPDHSEVILHLPSWFKKELNGRKPFLSLEGLWMGYSFLILV